MFFAWQALNCTRSLEPPLSDTSVLIHLLRSIFELLPEPVLVSSPATETAKLQQVSGRVFFKCIFRDLSIFMRPAMRRGALSRTSCVQNLATSYKEKQSATYILVHLSTKDESPAEVARSLETHASRRQRGIPDHFVHGEQSVSEPLFSDKPDKDANELWSSRILSKTRGVLRLQACRSSSFSRTIAARVSWSCSKGELRPCIPQPTLANATDTRTWLKPSCSYARAVNYILWLLQVAFPSLL